MMVVSETKYAPVVQLWCTVRWLPTMFDFTERLLCWVTLIDDALSFGDVETLCVEQVLEQAESWLQDYASTRLKAWQRRSVHVISP